VAANLVSLQHWSESAAGLATFRLWRGDFPLPELGEKRDVDYAAIDFPDLNFIVEHVGLPRLDDFCWIATQESNVYAGLSVAMALVHIRPKYFGEIMANLLFWLGPDKLLFGSDYAIWSPKWLIEKFMAYELPDDLKQEYHVDLTPGRTPGHRDHFPMQMPQHARNRILDAARARCAQRHRRDQRCGRLWLHIRLLRRRDKPGHRTDAHR
jgi:hypothetical protein